MKLGLAVLALIALSCNALADDYGLFYVAGGASTEGANYSIGAGTNVDVFEISSIDLGAVSGSSSAKFTGLSLVQNAAPINNFNLMFRVGFGKTTTSLANGASASRVGFGNGVIFGLGGQYQLNKHVAFRAEVNRLSYATSTDGLSSKLTYPVTISAMYLF